MDRVFDEKAIWAGLSSVDSPLPLSYARSSTKLLYRSVVTLARFFATFFRHLLFDTFEPAPNRQGYSSVYLSARPLAFSTGYLAALSCSFCSRAAPRSNFKSLPRSRREWSTSANSSQRPLRSAGQCRGKLLAGLPLHQGKQF